MESGKLGFVGKDSDSISANEKLAEIRTDIELTLKELKRQCNPNAHDVSSRYLKRKEKRSLLSVYKEHMKNVKDNLGQPGFTEGTRKAHNSLENIIGHFLKSQKRNDIQLSDIRQQFAKDLLSTCEL